jgi:hypothetical protein
MKRIFIAALSLMADLKRQNAPRARPMTSLRSLCLAVGRAEDQTQKWIKPATLMRRLIRFFVGLFST